MKSKHSEAAEALGTLYFYWALDPLIELAYAVSMDFVNRPQLYQSVPIIDELVTLRMQYGSAPMFPNAQQRQAMLNPVFSRSDAQRPDATATASPFYTHRKKLMDAATAYAERAVDTGIQMLKDRIASASVPLRTNLQAIYGKSVESTRRQINALFGLSIHILREPHIARAFGVDPPADKWPQESDDANGAKLVGIAGTTLSGLKSLAADALMTQERFVLLRRVAYEGSGAVREAYDYEHKKSDFDALVTTTYTWATSLRDYQS